MKKIFVTIVLACVAISSMAVELPKQGFGLQIGWAQPILRINNASSSPKDTLDVTVRMKGFKVGVVYDGSFIAGFGASMGINYTFGAYNSGWQSKNALGLDYPRDRQLITYHEMEVFVDWQYKFEVAKETYLMLYTGPTIQCGIGMDMRYDLQREDPVSHELITEYNHYNGYNPTETKVGHIAENEHFKRLNVTWGLGAGFQYKRYFLRGGYDFGLLNPYANSQFVDAAGNPKDHYTRGRLDQWNVRIGMYLWYAE